MSVAVMFTACEKEENVFLISTDPMAAQCTDDGVWNACYTNTTGFDLDDIHFSHSSLMEPYKTWSGFCPSTVRDTKEYSDDEWVDHQWATIVGHGAAGDYASSYLVAYWEVMDAGDPLNSSCVISGTNGISFMPYDVYVSNTTWGYYAMKNGTEFSEAFTGEDWFKVTITGYRNGLVTGSVDVTLAEKGIISQQWEKVRLRKLGLIDHLVFSLSSSTMSEWGMTNPAFFCIDALHMH